MTRPLRIACVATACDGFDPPEDRIQMSQVDASEGRSLWKSWRTDAPDVAIVIQGSPEAKTARWVSALSGVPIVEMNESDRAGVVTRRAAIAAARPGAGLDGDRGISIVVPVLNDAEPLERLLRALAVQLTADDEIVIVDGGSTDDTLQRAEVYSKTARIHVVHAPGTNIPEARNLGVKEASNELIALTDAGCTPVYGWLAALRAAFAESPPPRLVTGVYRVAARGPWEEAMAVSCYPVVEEAGRAGILTRAFARVFGRSFDPTMPTGRSLGIDADAWTSVGGMPEHLETAEDVTFGRAVADAGHECVLSRDAEVVWEQRPNLRSTAKMYFRYGVGGGLSADPLVVGRDLARALAYAVVPYLFVTRGSALRTVIVGLGSAYISIPVARAMKRPNPVTVAALTAPAVILKDLSKAAGCVAGIARRKPRR